MRHNRPNVIIVASGPSVRAVTPRDILDANAVVIAVNGAIEWLTTAHYWFTLDPSATNQQRMRRRVAGCVYLAAVPERCLLPPGVIRLRRTEGGLFGRVRACAGLSDVPGTVHTGNSAYGALGVAYAMRARRVLLLGVDGTQSPRVTGGSPRSLHHLPELFATASDQLSARGVAVRNGSLHSKVTCFACCTPEEGLSWIKQ